MAKCWGMERYKGFLIAGSAVPKFATGFDWYSQGTVLQPGRLGSIVEVLRIKGSIFNSKEAAEEDDFRLCKDWIDKRPWALLLLRDSQKSTSCTVQFLVILYLE